MKHSETTHVLIPKRFFCAFLVTLENLGDLFLFLGNCSHMYLNYNF